MELLLSAIAIAIQVMELLLSAIAIAIVLTILGSVFNDHHH